MPSRPPYARIAITLPPETLAAADRLARAQDRSRSWIVSEAVRRYAASVETAPDPTLGGAGLGASRTMQLLRDLALTPEQRVHLADETLLSLDDNTLPVVRESRSFDRYEDFLDWKRERHLTP